jgi:hypothetical protein
MDDVEALVEGAREAVHDAVRDLPLERIIRTAVYDAVTDHLERHRLERLT